MTAEEVSRLSAKDQATVNAGCLVQVALREVAAELMGRWNRGDHHPLTCDSVAGVLINVANKIESVTQATLGE